MFVCYALIGLCIKVDVLTIFQLTQDSWTLIVNVDRMASYEQSDSYHKLYLSSPIQQGIMSLASQAKRRKWDLTSDSALLKPKKFSYCVGRNRKLMMEMESKTGLMNQANVELHGKSKNVACSPGANEIVSSSTPMPTTSLHSHEQTSVQFGCE